jgi:RNA polymerase sigma-70 factor, ECF subfamily
MNAATGTFSPLIVEHRSKAAIQEYRRDRAAHPTFDMSRPGQNRDDELEAALIAQIANGKESAFSALYARFSGPLFGLAQRMLHDAREAEDVLQEGFTYIWRKASSYDSSRSTPFAWAVMITRNKAIDRLRARQRQERLQDRVTDEEEYFRQEDLRSALEPEVRDRAQRIRQALGSLPEEQRRSLELAFFGGLTHEEIASKLNAPLGTIKARIRRGLLKLRDSLKEGGV